RATQYAHQVADLYLPTPANTGATPAPPLPKNEGFLFRSANNGEVLNNAPAGSTWILEGNRGHVTSRYGVTHGEDRVPKGALKPTGFTQLAGVYSNDEIETALTVAVEGTSLVVKRRPNTTFMLEPLYVDAFSAPRLGVLLFRRDGSGRVTALSVVQDRVWDL